MLWAALLPDNLPDDPKPRTEALDGLATWCLQLIRMTSRPGC